MNNIIKKHKREHSNIIREVKLPFITWDDFLSGKAIFFQGIFPECYYQLYSKDHKIIIYDVDGQEIIFSKDLSLESFYNAYEICKDLFLGEININDIGK